MNKKKSSQFSLHSQNFKAKMQQKKKAQLSSGRSGHPRTDDARDLSGSSPGSASFPGSMTSKLALAQMSVSTFGTFLKSHLRFPFSLYLVVIVTIILFSVYIWAQRESAPKLGQKIENLTFAVKCS